MASAGYGHRGRCRGPIYKARRRGAASIVGGHQPGLPAGRRLPPCILIAVAGFLVMLVCSLWAVTSYRRMTGSTTGRVPAKGGGAGKERRGGRAGWQAGGPGADGAARGALAAPPGGRPLTSRLLPDVSGAGDRMPPVLCWAW